MTHAAITGWGKCLPPAVLTNEDLSTILDTNDEWIVSRTGIRERRISHVGLEELAFVAAARALAAAGLAGADTELIVFGSCSYDDQVPNMASGVQLRLGAHSAAALDINTACTSFLYGLSTASALIRTGVVRNALVIGAEPGTRQRLLAGTRHALHRALEDLLTFELPARDAVEDAAVGIAATHTLYAQRLARVRVAAELLGEQAFLIVARLQHHCGGPVAEQHRDVAVAPVHER